MVGSTFNECRKPLDNIWMVELHKRRGILRNCAGPYAADSFERRTNASCTDESAIDEVSESLQ